MWTIKSPLVKAALIASLISGCSPNPRIDPLSGQVRELSKRDPLERRNKGYSLENVIRFLKEQEGTERNEDGTMRVYKDSAGKDTIGYGHLMESGDKRINISDEEAELLLRKDIAKAVRAVDRLVTRQLAPEQKEALISLVFNVGPAAFAKSKALENLNNNDMVSFLDEAFGYEKGFNKITKKDINGNTYKVVSDGLAKRRSMERDLFMNKLEGYMYDVR